MRTLEIGKQGVCIEHIDRFNMAMNPEARVRVLIIHDSTWMFRVGMRLPQQLKRHQGKRLHQEQPDANGQDPAACGV
jgi:hypothetical protein